MAKAFFDQEMAANFHCPKCGQTGAHVERLAMAGTGLSRFMDIQTHRYIFASCRYCGFTEVYNMKILEGRDDLGDVMEILFMNQGEGDGTLSTRRDRRRPRR